MAAWNSIVAHVEGTKQAQAFQREKYHELLTRVLVTLSNLAHQLDTDTLATLAGFLFDSLCQGERNKSMVLSLVHRVLVRLCRQGCRS